MDDENGALLDALLKTARNDAYDDAIRAVRYYAAGLEDEQMAERLRRDLVPIIERRKGSPAR